MPIEKLAALVIFWPTPPWEPVVAANQKDVVQQWSDRLEGKIVPACVRTVAVVDVYGPWTAPANIDASKFADCVYNACAWYSRGQAPRAVAVGLKTPFSAPYESYSIADQTGHLLRPHPIDIDVMLHRVFDPAFAHHVLQVIVLLGPGIL